MDQVSDIDNIIKKLHKEQHIRDKLNANLRNKKMGKNQGVRSN